MKCCNERNAGRVTLRANAKQDVRAHTIRKVEIQKGAGIAFQFQLCICNGSRLDNLKPKTMKQPCQRNPAVIVIFNQ